MRIKVVSLNVWAGKLLSDVIAFLKQEDAEVVLLQEVTNAEDASLADQHRILSVLKVELDYNYTDYAHNFNYNLPEGIVPEGNVILSKLPIKSTYNRYFIEPTKEYYQDIPEDWPIVPRILQQVQLETEAGAVNIINVHGVWDLDGDNDSPERRKMVEAIIERSQQPKTIVGGDTNAKSSNPIWRELEGRLTPVFGPELKTTFNMRRKDNPGYATAAVDLIFVSSDITIVDKAVPEIDVSDHLPLVVTLNIA